MSYAEVDTFAIEGTRYRGRIVYDPEPANPRKEYDQIATMWCWHRRYDLGDEEPSFDPSDFWRELARMAHPHEFDNDCPHCELGYKLDEAGERTEEFCHMCEGTGEKPIDECQREAEEVFIVSPLYLYDHSGITISMGAFSCPWDSGQVGYIFVERAKAKAEWGVYADKDILERMRGEVEAYDRYLTGQIFGYIIDRVDEDAEVVEDHIDSCWGFDDEEYCKDECINVAKYLERKHAEEAHAEDEERAHWEARDVVTKCPPGIN